MADTFSFIGFNNKTYDLPSFPSESSNYKEYVITLDNFSNYYLFCFNDKFEIIKGSSNYEFYVENGDAGKIYFYTSSNGVWKDMSKSILKVAYWDEPSVIYSSNNLAEYSITYNKNHKNGLLWEAPLVSPFVLAPIMEVQQNVPQNTFVEIFSILPVLMVVLISYIGIRKAIGYMSKLLRYS